MYGSFYNATLHNTTACDHIRLRVSTYTYNIIAYELHVITQLSYCESMLGHVRAYDHILIDVIVPKKT